jgi:hypothetical protein
MPSKTCDPKSEQFWVTTSVFRVAKAMLSREDPTEAFFKQLADAHTSSHVSMTFPVCSNCHMLSL